MEQVSLKLHLFRSYLWSKTASLLIGFALFFYNSGVLYSTLEKAMATHSRILAWRIPGTEEPGGLPCMGLHRVGHGWSDLAAAAAALHISRNFRLLNILAANIKKKIKYIKPEHKNWGSTRCSVTTQRGGMQWRGRGAVGREVWESEHMYT